MNQTIITERVIINLVFSLKCPIDSFTDISFIMPVYGQLSCKSESDNFANLEARLSVVIVVSRSK